MTQRLPSLLATLAITSALGACNSHTPAAPSRYTSLDATLDSIHGVDPGPSSARVPERRATPVVILPAWIGRQTRLRERDEAGVFEQAIGLGAGPRQADDENAVVVSVGRPDRASEPPRDGAVGHMEKPTQAGIRAEMEAAFPGIAMQVVTRPAANAYGPYGLAIGREPAGGRCLYAWQWIAEPPALAAEQNPAAPMSLRVRLCRADMTLEAMAAAVNQLRIVPRFAGTPVAGTAVARSSAIRTSAVRSPSVQARAATRRRVTELRHPVHRGQGAIERAEPEARRDFAPATFAPPSLPDSSGRRYLGSEGASAAPAAAIVPGVLAGLGAGVAAPASGVTSADLPPEATRGPAGPSAR